MVSRMVNLKENGENQQTAESANKNINNKGQKYVAAGMRVIYKMFFCEEVL